MTAKHQNPFNSNLKASKCLKSYPESSTIYEIRPSLLLNSTEAHPNRQRFSSIPHKIHVFLRRNATTKRRLHSWAYSALSILGENLSSNGGTECTRRKLSALSGFMSSLGGKWSQFTQFWNRRVISETGWKLSALGGYLSLLGGKCHSAHTLIKKNAWAHLAKNWAKTILSQFVPPSELFSEALGGHLGQPGNRAPGQDEN